MTSNIVKGLVVLEALTMAVRAVEELRRLAAADPDAGQHLLRAAWVSHRKEYQNLIEENAELHKTIKLDARYLAALTAVTTLEAYFMFHGDWDKMIADLSARRQLLAKELKV